MFQTCSKTPVKHPGKTLIFSSPATNPEPKIVMKCLLRYVLFDDRADPRAHKTSKIAFFFHVHAVHSWEPQSYVFLAELIVKHALKREWAKAEHWQLWAFRMKMSFVSTVFISFSTVSHVFRYSDIDPNADLEQRILRPSPFEEICEDIDFSRSGYIVDTLSWHVLTCWNISTAIAVAHPRMIEEFAKRLSKLIAGWLRVGWPWKRGYNVLRICAVHICAYLCMLRSTVAILAPRLRMLRKSKEGTADGRVLVACFVRCSCYLLLFNTFWVFLKRYCQGNFNSDNCLIVRAQEGKRCISKSKMRWNTTDFERRVAPFTACHLSF